jgi:hypothetical protein
MQRLIYGLVGLAALAVVALSTMLVRRHLPPATPSPVVTPSPPLAPARCRDVTRVPGPVLPSASAATLRVTKSAEVTVLVDGAPPLATLDEGLHVIEASGAGAASAKLSLHVDAFAAVLIDARISAGAVTLLPLGARCDACPHSDTELDLGYRRGIGDVSGAALALSKGDWLLAAQQLRAIAPEDRTSPELTRLVAVLASLAGRGSVVRAQLAHLPKSDPLVAAAAKREVEETATPKRQLASATARWNATSDRFQALTERFVADAPELMTALTKRFEPLSAQFVRAEASHDAIGCEGVLDQGSSALKEAVAKLRAMRPTDCAWQNRISQVP